MGITDELVAMEASPHVRPAWDLGSNLSRRAKECLLREWLQAGIITEAELDADIEAGESPFRRVQYRHSATVTLPEMVDHTSPPSVITTSKGPADAPEAPWSTWRGVLLRPGERAMIGIDTTGRPVHEEFRPGAVTLPPDGRVVGLNRAHDAARVLGHLTSVTERDGQVVAAGILVDTIPDAAHTRELVRAGSLRSLSLEFHEIPGQSEKRRLPDGSRLVTHNKVLLSGVGVVARPAYKTASITHLLDRRESGRERERVRRQHVAHLRSLNADAPQRR